MISFKKLDQNSRILIIIGLFGILISSIGLYYSTFEESGNISDPIARISQMSADTRIKRSGNLHWFSVEKPLPCQRDDLIFTGEDSTATIEFPNGDKVHLLPNSLVSISDRLLTLESGAIEVDLGGSEEFSIKTLGRVTKIKEKNKFRVIQNNLEKRIIPLTTKMPELTALNLSFESQENKNKAETIPEVIASGEDTSIPTITIENLPEKVDFLRNTPKIKVKSSHPLKGLTYFLSSKEAELKGEIDGESFTLPFLKDGLHSLKVSGQTEDGKEVSSESYTFEVNNSKPPQAPKIKGKKKVKIFVYLLQNFFNFLIPESYAASNQVHPLKWYSDDEGIYEIEITSKDKSKVIERKELKGDHYDFVIPYPGNFHWRVRQKKDGSWGPFSPFAEISAHDKIELLNAPLMKRATVKGENFTFEWQEPHDDFSYVLSIYRGRTSRPELTIPVKGGRHTLRLQRNDQKIYWRISAISTWGEENKDRKKFAIQNSAVSEDSKETSLSKYHFIFRAIYLHGFSSYHQKTDDEHFVNSNMKFNPSGPNVLLKGEVWNKKFGAILSVRHQESKNSDVSYQESEIAGEIGYHWIKTSLSSHKLALGGLYGPTKLNFYDTQGSYTRAFITLRHQYERKISPRYSFTLNSSLLESVHFNVIPSIRIMPELNWHLKKNMWIAFIVGYEMNRTRLLYAEDGNEGEFSISSNVMLYGLGVNWSL